VQTYLIFRQLTSGSTLIGANFTAVAR